MRRRINLCDIFVMLWGIYYLQGILYSPGILNQAVQLLMILFGLYAVCQYIMNKSKSRLINATIALIVMYCIYGTFIILYGDGIAMTPDSSYLKSSLNSLLPIVFFYNQTRCGNLNHKRICLYTFFILIITIALYNYNALRVIELKRVDEITNNVGYVFVAIMPLIYFFSKKPLLQYILLAIILVYVLMGMKRGAIAIAAICFIIFVVSKLKEKSSWKKKLIIISLFLILIILFSNIISTMLQTSDYFMARIESTLEGNLSGRDILFSRISDAVLGEQNVLKILFGHGANSTIKFAGNFAHQDWLETACNNGLFGLVILLNFFVILWLDAWNSRKYISQEMFYCFLTLFIMSFVKTMFSMSIQDLDISQSMLLGYLGSSVNKSKSNYISCR